jgi:hypothetical protein
MTENRVLALTESSAKGIQIPTFIFLFAISNPCKGAEMKNN